MKLTEFRKLTAQEERDLVTQRPPWSPPDRRVERDLARKEFERSPAWKAWLASDARRTLIECNIPWALKVARTAKLGNDRDGVAMLALCLAADHFEPDKGRMTTYLKQTVFNHVLRDWAANRSVVRVPEQVQRYVRDLDRGGPDAPRSPTLDRLAPFARVAMAPPCRDTRSRDTSSVWDGIADHRDRDDSGAAASDRVDRLMAALDRLSPEQAIVVRLYHLGDSPEPPTQRQVAAVLGISRQAVHQRLDSAYGRLRAELKRPASARPARPVELRPAEFALLTAALQLEAEGREMTWTLLGYRSRLGGNYAFQVARRLKVSRPELWTWKVIAVGGTVVRDDRLANRRSSPPTR